MIKIFYYELRRCLFNKFFFGILVVTALFSIQLMEGDIILGVANTAPFSPWSFGTYLSRLLPLLLIALLFFLSFHTSKQELTVQVLTNATPMSPLIFRLLNVGAITAAFAVITLVPVGYGWWFYGATFHYTSFGELVLPMLFTLLPAFLLVMGLGALAGRIHTVLVFVLMPIVLLLGFLPVSGNFDLLGTSFFMNYPKTLGVLDPAFSLPAGFILGKCVYSAAGILMLAAVVMDMAPPKQST